MAESITYTYPSAESQRLDAFLAKEMTELSRSRIQALIKSGDITVNSTVVKPKYSLEQHDKIDITIPDP